MYVIIFVQKQFDGVGNIFERKVLLPFLQCLLPNRAIIFFFILFTIANLNCFLFSLGRIVGFFYTFFILEKIKDVSILLKLGMFHNVSM